jgi:hypothetical protein
MDSDSDHLSHSSALEIARRLRRYWLDRGYNISTKVEAVQARGRQDVWVVRSNLVGGHPPAHTKIEAVDEAA